MRPNVIKIKSSLPDKKPTKNVIKEDEDIQTYEANVDIILGTLEPNQIPFLFVPHPAQAQVNQLIIERIPGQTKTTASNMAEGMKLQVPRVKLGTQGLEVSKLGFGCMSLSGGYNSPVSEEDGISIIKHAFNKGITFFDTADKYGPYTNEILLGKALKMLPRENIQVATKFGFAELGLDAVIVKGNPEYVRSCCEASLKRLDVEYIDLYYQHRVDTSVPIEETIGEMKKLVEEGKIKYIGLSEASPDTIRRAHAVHPITAVQLEWSLWTRDIENEIVPLCRELGIGIVPYSPLGRGFFGGKAVVESVPPDSFLVCFSSMFVRIVLFHNTV
ncbi:hypothetical protein CICLE_v10001273mg [Citrus x clementina]|uniref:NADP-dependent oxidoreductase domain-containing protein n=2 Tax=Citrus TaxID=2706 RepID=V4SZD9_CITCL|nr:hypothetical protein CICLE_v10001273mg [Citrus x clementina]